MIDEAYHGSNTLDIETRPKDGRALRHVRVLESKPQSENAIE